MDFEVLYEDCIEKFIINFADETDEEEILACTDNYADILNEHFWGIIRQEKKTYIYNLIYYRIINMVNLICPIPYNKSIVENMIDAYKVTKKFVGKYIELNYYLYDLVEEIDVLDKDTLIKYFSLYSLVENCYIKDFNEYKKYCDLLDKNYTSNFTIEEFNINRFCVYDLENFIKEKGLQLKGEQQNVRRINKYN